LTADLVPTGGLCAQCGKPLQAARRGGMRKRFCDHDCRNRFHNGRQARKKIPAQPDRSGAEERRATLLWLYEQLKRDVDVLGTLVPTKDSVKANPSLAGLRGVIADLERLAPIEQEQPDELESLIAV
jgi:hypothetical protein